MKRIIISVLITIVVLAALPFVVLGTGVVNMGASDAAGSMEKAIASFAVQRSLAVRAPDATSELLDDPQAISAGLDHYTAMCVRCHGGPGVEAEEFAAGLNPPAPKLEHVAEEFTDGELFWITKHGIRMTGMPAFGATHEDEEIWKIVAFVRQLPELSEERRALLQQKASVSHHDRRDEHPQATDEQPHSSNADHKHAHRG